MRADILSDMSRVKLLRMYVCIHEHTAIYNCSSSGSFSSQHLGGILRTAIEQYNSFN